MRKENCRHSKDEGKSKFDLCGYSCVLQCNLSACACVCVWVCECVGVCARRCVFTEESKAKTQLSLLLRELLGFMIHEVYLMLGNKSEEKQSKIGHLAVAILLIQLVEQTH